MPKWRTAPKKRGRALREPESHVGVRTTTKMFTMARNRVLETHPASGRYLALYLLQIKIGVGVHCKENFNRSRKSIMLGYLPLSRQQQNRAARRRCRAVLLHQLERLAHAHEAQVCAGDSSCEDDGARQPISWSVYRSACPIGLKRRGVRLNNVEFVLHNTAVTNRQYNYVLLCSITNYFIHMVWRFQLNMRCIY